MIFQLPNCNESSHQAVPNNTTHDQTLAIPQEPNINNIHQLLNLDNSSSLEHVAINENYPVRHNKNSRYSTQTGAIILTSRTRPWTVFSRSYHGAGELETSPSWSP
jgi:hypothetical protein